MKPAPFEFVRAASLDETFGAIARFGDDARILAGGQSLMPILNMRLAQPSALIDINGIQELSGIAVVDGKLRIGALTRHAELLTSADVARHAPLLAQAAPHIAHPAIRNRGTIGGSLAHADPAAELPACVLAHDATLNIAGPNGTRAVAAADFFQGIFETALDHGEILTSVDIPPMAGGAVAAFDELARRHGDYAVTGLAAVGSARGGSFAGLRVVFFALADRPVLAANAAAALEGQSDLTDAVRAALADDLADVADDLHTSAATKRHLAGVLLGRVLATIKTEAGR
ncbi:MAG: xanthine dehydrogenase family protein subunit M [Rhodospirillaceae bacterium]